MRHDGDHSDCGQCRYADASQRIGCKVEECGTERSDSPVCKETVVNGGKSMLAHFKSEVTSSVCICWKSPEHASLVRLDEVRSAYALMSSGKSGVTAVRQAALY